MGSDKITHKSGNGKGLAVLGFLGLATVGAGIYAYYSLTGDTSVVDQEISSSNPSYSQSDAPVTAPETVAEPVTVSNPETHVEGDAPILEPVIEPIAEPVETHWYIERAGFEDAQVGTYSNMFGEDIYAVKNSAYGSDNYNLFDLDVDKTILKHQEWNPSQLRLDLELSSDQYRALNAQYGTMISATMETIDNDPTSAGMDRVAIHYVGTGGLEWDAYFEYHDDAKVEDYIGAKLNPELYPMLKEIKL